MSAAASSQINGVGSSQDYYQTFSAVAAGRATERLTFEQFIDTSHRGLNAQWTRPINKVTMIVGGDYRHTDALQDEFRYVLVSGVNTRTGPFLSGGTENCGRRLRARQHRRHRRLDLRDRGSRRFVEVGARRSSAAHQGSRLTSARAAPCRMRAGRYQYAGVGLLRQPHADPERAASPLRGRQPDHQRQPAARARKR